MKSVKSQQPRGSRTTERRGGSGYAMRKIWKWDNATGVRGLDSCGQRGSSGKRRGARHDSEECLRCQLRKRNFSLRCHRRSFSVAFPVPPDAFNASAENVKRRGIVGTCLSPFFNNLAPRHRPSALILLIFLSVPPCRQPYTLSVFSYFPRTFISLFALAPLTAAPLYTPRPFFRLLFRLRPLSCSLFISLYSFPFSNVVFFSPSLFPSAVAVSPPFSSLRFAVLLNIVSLF